MNKIKIVSTDANEKTVSGQENSGSFSENLKTVFLAIFIALIIRSFFFEPFRIPSGSMYPTLRVGDYLFVSKYTYGYSRYSFRPDCRCLRGVFGTTSRSAAMWWFSARAASRTPILLNALSVCREIEYR